MIKENKKKVFLILLGLFLLTGWFYWFQYRPTKIRSYCHNQANGKPESTSGKSSLVDKYYPAEESSEGKPQNLYERLTAPSREPIPVSPEKYKFLYDSCLHEKGLK